MSFYIKRIIKYLFLPFGIIYSFFCGNRPEIVILMYHRVNDKVSKELSVKMKDFIWQMEYLQRKGYKVISMDEAYSMMEKRDIDDNYIVISFDDGYLDYYINAYPILKRYLFPSIIYTVPAYMISGELFWWDEDDGNGDLIDMETLIDLSKDDLVTIGSHTMKHIDMDKLSREDTEYELRESKRFLEEYLEREILHFAYPRGIYSKKCEEFIGDYYATGVLISTGISITNDISKKNFFKLKRVPVLQSDGRLLFAARLRGWLVLEEYIRRFIRG